MHNLECLPLGQPDDSHRSHPESSIKQLRYIARRRGEA